MKLYVIRRKENFIVVLLDNRMRIVKPVYEFLKYLQLRDKAINTIKAYGRDLKIYWEFLDTKNYDYKSISPKDIGEFKEYLREPLHDDRVVFYNAVSQRTGKTINRILGTIYNFYKYCALVSEIDNPILMDTINRPPNMFKGILHHISRDNKSKKSVFKVKEFDKPIKLVSEEEALTIMNALRKKRDKLIFKILYITGARIDEVLGLKIEEIPCPVSSQQVAILHNIKSKGKRRDLYMPMSLLEEIDNYIMEERNRIDTEHSYIFVSLQKQNLGKHLTYGGIYEVFERVKKKVNIKFNFHDLRHTRITNLIESGMDISVARIIAGHRHITTTQNYEHLSNKYIEANLGSYWKSSSLLYGGSNV